MFKLIDKLRLENYVSSRLILSLDLFISLGCSLFSLFLVGVLFSSFSYNNILPYCAIGSLLSSALFFILFQTHKVIIRHSTLRELWKLGIAVLGKGLAIALIIWSIDNMLLLNVYIISYLIFDILLSISALVAVRIMMIIYQ